MINNEENLNISMNIYSHIPILKNLSSLYTHINFVDNPKDADLVIVRAPLQKSSPAFDGVPKTIYLLDVSPNRGTHRGFHEIRKGFCVDDAMNLPKLTNFSFSNNDICNDPHLIQIPCPFNDPVTINQPKLYWQLEKKIDIQYTEKVFWKGNFTHESRKNVFDYYTKKNDPRFTLEEFHHKVYLNKPQQLSNTDFYNEYINQIQNSDMCFNLRGDRPSTYSFFDIIEYGCIPININNMEFGWENIMNNVGDYMLNFDLRTQSMDEIHKEIITVLEDRERVLKMKQNCIKLFNTFFKYTTDDPWKEFILAKCIQIYKNNFDIEKIDNKLICTELLELKKIKEKI